MLQESGADRVKTAKEPKTSEGLKSLIAKLRWAGQDQEVERLCHELETMAPEDCVPPGPVETD